MCLTHLPCWYRYWNDCCHKWQWILLFCPNPLPQDFVHCRDRLVRPWCSLKTRSFCLVAKAWVAILKLLINRIMKKKKHLIKYAYNIKICRISYLERYHKIFCKRKLVISASLCNKRSASRFWWAMVDWNCGFIELAVLNNYAQIECWKSYLTIHHRRQVRLLKSQSGFIKCITLEIYSNQLSFIW